MSELAWAAGLFVGEGNVGITRSHKLQGWYEYLKLQLGMYDERAVQRFAEAICVSYSTYWLPKQEHWFYRASAVGRTAEKALATLWPYLEGTDKGDQVIQATRKLDEGDAVLDWIINARMGNRPQRQNMKRGRFQRD